MGVKVMKRLVTDEILTKFFVFNRFAVFASKSVFPMLLIVRQRILVGCVIQLTIESMVQLGNLIVINLSFQTEEIQHERQQIVRFDAQSPGTAKE